MEGASSLRAGVMLLHRGLRRGDPAPIDPPSGRLGDRQVACPGVESVTLKAVFDPETGQLLGVQAFGKDSVDKRIDVLATATVDNHAPKRDE